jgi:phosphodiesterase/alkaline phosphatase D-like protein
VSDQPRAETLTIDGKTYKTTDAPTSDAFKEIKIDGLQPGTVYGYEVRESGGSFAKGKFRTFPAGPEPFRFAGIGDTRSNFFIHKQLVDAIKKQKPAFVINTGDLVDDGTKPEDWPPFWKVVGPLVRNTYYYPAIGNHEKDSPIYYKYFSLPNNGGAEKYYSFTYGNVFVACLDFEQLYSGEQKSWLIKQLKATNADFKIVAVHVPFYSSSKREPNTGIRSIYVPVLKKYGVQLVLHGHDHFYERSVDSNGIQYVVTGGGGAPLYDFEREVPESKVRVKNYEYMIFDINGKQMDAKTIDVDGKVIDTFSITAK